MSYKITRRSLLASLPVVAAFAETKPLKIGAVEIWRVNGHRETMRGVDHQYQVNQLNIYDEFRPKPYADAAEPAPAQSPHQRSLPESQNRNGRRGVVRTHRQGGRDRCR